MPLRRDDLTFGFASEETNLNTLQTFFGTPLKRQGGYSTMDYTNEGNTVYVELKTRRVPSSKYPTAIVGCNKVDYCKDANKTYYFVFCYEDGLHYIKYEKELFDTFERDNNYFRGARADCYNPRQSIIHIPISKLSKVQV